MLYYVILHYIILYYIILYYLMQEWLDAEVPLLSKTGCLAQSLRGACAILTQNKCKILPGLVAAKTELHIAIVWPGGSCKVCDS